MSMWIAHGDCPFIMPCPIIMPCPEISKLLTSKPSQPYRGTFKPDLAVFVNLDTLITNLLYFFPAVASLSSTSASKFEFI